jgi:hypothetical protein
MPDRYLKWAEPIPEGDSPQSEAGRVPPAWAKPMVCHIVRGEDGERKRGEEEEEDEEEEKERNGEREGGEAETNVDKS